MEPGDEEEHISAHSRTSFSTLLTGFAYTAHSSTTNSTARPVLGVDQPISSPRKRKRIEEEDQGVGIVSAKKREGVISHLPPLQDRLALYLDVVFCGCNPGHTSAVVGLHYGNTQNAFWKCLHGSGFTETVLHPTEGPNLPSKYNIGLTDLVTTPSHSFADISTQERRNSVLALLQKIARFKPRIVAFNSFAIWTDIANGLEPLRRSSFPPKSAKANKTRNGLKTAKEVSSACITLEPPLGEDQLPPLKLESTKEKRTPQFLPWKIVYAEGETLLIPLPGTSGANASYSLSEKIAFFKAVNDAVQSIKQGTMDTSHMARIIVREDIV
ncbi:SubName: Full=Related to G/T mismatch-specific thymine DNA glycosylase {ECO:0000313/EMBL:CCA68975.1} [Serendipita indica DSM 11827]|uniref:Related to G/T mismatch-specific thymine DNA glycosylase n=1 Tax=Serendipita indica (strain DSM 11827) TaxID=1109443 RepID=G4TCD2_SERID|nr:SubName: Full=Related to G/T mismatch-specific thymine DNA glycosylase {ECO:0000313/EMBL:CCA68975.1} [Serendipita indica DSM 11827]CCA68975.1 related to G/T mismatch-specific thymine DNA glycosylase [Serendipita indica DSM 11827]